MTDVTGFGLLGHLLEMCRGAGLEAEIRFDQVPILPAALALAKQGYGPGAIERNMESYGRDVRFSESIQTWQQRLLADAQTSGGLLVSVDEASCAEVLACFHRAGFEYAAVIGKMKNGVPNVSVI
jgi:selenide,water dikinase